MRRRIPVILAVVSALLVCVSARAQMVDSEPETYTVTADQAEVRCGWGSDGWYSVGRVPRDGLLVVDGREGEWLRVRYPDGLGFGVLFRASDLTIDAGTATLTRPARPIYANRADTVTGSWMKMTGEPFQPGATFTVLDTLGPNGEMVLVVAPESVRGYVLASDVRRADDGARPAAPDTADESAAASPAEASAPQPLAENEDSHPAEGGPATASDTPGSDGVDDESARGDSATPEEPALEVTDPRAVPTPEELFAAYDTVVREPIESAELEPLIAEFASGIAAVPEGSRERALLASRLSLLELRRDLQRDLRAVVSATERAAREQRAIDELVVDWRSRPEYSAVGRLLASALYDGRRLPLMYRLQSLDGLGGRTIAYIVPDDALDLDAKLGGVVGVVGPARRDRTIRVRLIEPERVDLLEPGR